MTCQAIHVANVNAMMPHVPASWTSDVARVTEYASSEADMRHLGVDGESHARSLSRRGEASSALATPQRRSVRRVRRDGSRSMQVASGVARRGARARPTLDDAGRRGSTPSVRSTSQAGPVGPHGAGGPTRD